MAERNIICGDALQWLEEHSVLPGSSFFVSLPDISEFPQWGLEEWKNWFIQTSRLILSRCPDDGVVVFFQSDIKFEGQWIDKGYLCQKAAELEGFKTLWHKMACRAPIGVITFGRPSYSHILCFSRTHILDVSKSTPDVLPEMGDKTWQRGMGLSVALMIGRFIKNVIGSHTIINPFCGEGSMLAAANILGINAIGIEKGKKRAAKAMVLSVSEDLGSWIEGDAKNSSHI